MTLTKLAYLRRFTSQERIAIRAAAASDPLLYDYMALLELAEDIDTTDPDTVAAVTMLEDVGLLAAGRAAEILGDLVQPTDTLPTGTARVYRIDGNYTTCLSTDTQPAQYDAAWDISALYAALIEDGADISDTGGVLTIGKQVA